MAENRQEDVKPIILERNIAAPIDVAFLCFTDDLGGWWPSAYTWAQNKLSSIWIDRSLHGFCVEEDAEGLRRHWGLITNIRKNRVLEFRWLIEGDRSQIYDPALASRVKIEWEEAEDSVRLSLIHDQFERHLTDPAEYRGGLASEYGWPLLLEKFASFCENWKAPGVSTR